MDLLRNTVVNWIGKTFTFLVGHPNTVLLFSLDVATTWFAVKGAPATSVCRNDQVPLFSLLVFHQALATRILLASYIKQVWSKINNTEVASFLWFLSLCPTKLVYNCIVYTFLWFPLFPFFYWGFFPLSFSSIMHTHS